jgi:hypothetical protein
MPVMDELLDELVGAKFFTKLVFLLWISPNPAD